MTNKHYVGEIGTEILLDTGVTITGATETKIKCEKPDGTLVDWTATIKETTKLTYLTVANDFNQSGLYKVQASLTLSGWTGLGETATFKVYDAFTVV